MPVAGMAEGNQAVAILCVEVVAVMRRELIAVEKQQPEVDLVGAVWVCGVPHRLDVGRVVVQDVDNKVRLVLVGTDDARVAGYIVGD